MAVGDKIDVVAAVGVYNTTLQLRNSLASEITKVVVTPDPEPTPNPDEDEDIEATGDFSIVLPLVLVLMGGAVVIVASKKRFA